jgi:hypothetical protein
MRLIALYVPDAMLPSGYPPVSLVMDDDITEIRRTSKTTKVSGKPTKYFMPSMSKGEPTPYIALGRAT